jgi:hypothetical protein
MEIKIALNGVELQKLIDNGVLFKVLEANTYGTQTQDGNITGQVSYDFDTSGNPTLEVPVTPEEVNVVPTGTQTYTLDDLSGAAAKIMTSPEMQTKLISMMQTFGVNSLGELDPSQYGDAALKLRELGAEI